jgi:hypothetical protein
MYWTGTIFAVVRSSFDSDIRYPTRYSFSLSLLMQETDFSVASGSGTDPWKPLKAMMVKWTGLHHKTLKKSSISTRQHFLTSTLLS